MDMDSPGVDWKQQHDGPVKVTNSRMDTLLATLKRDIKALRCQGDLVAETMWQLYRTFEDVVSERSAAAFISDEQTDEDFYPEDGDSGVATATEDSREDSPRSTGLMQNGRSHGDVKCLSNSNAENEKYVPPRAWYELDEEDGEDGCHDDDEGGEETNDDSKSTRNGLTEEWVKYGHFQQTGKHYELSGEKVIHEKDSDTIQYDWESFTDDDDVATLTYDWEALEDGNWTHHNEKRERNDSRQKYHMGDKKDTTKHHPRVHHSDGKVGHHHNNNYDKATCNNMESPSNQSTLESPRTHRSGTAINTRKQLYRNISSDILSALSRPPVTTPPRSGSCKQKNIDVVCTCEHTTDTVRATHGGGGSGKRTDRNNNNDKSRLLPNKRIMTNGSLSSIRKKKAEQGLVGNIRATHKEFDELDKRTLQRAFSERIPRAFSTPSLPNNSKLIQGAHMHNHYRPVFQRRSMTNIAGNRRPVVLDDITALNESERASGDAYSENIVHDQHYYESTGVQKSTPSNCSPGVNHAVAANGVNKRITWDLGGQDFDLDQELAKDGHDYARISEKPPRLRTTYHGAVLPNKRPFPTKEHGLTRSQRSIGAKTCNGTTTTPHDRTGRRHNDKETLRLCGIRYAGFQAAWQSSNTVGNRRSFSGFTVINKPRPVSNNSRRWDPSMDQLQSTYC